MCTMKAWIRALQCVGRLRRFWFADRWLVGTQLCFVLLDWYAYMYACTVILSCLMHGIRRFAHAHDMYEWVIEQELL